MYPQGKKAEVFTTTGGNPYVSLNATTGLYRLGPWPYPVHLRAVAFVQTATNVKGGGVISVRLASNAGSTATVTVIDTITTTTVGNASGRGSVFFVEGLRTTVSVGSDVFARITTGASKVQGKIIGYVDSNPFDLSNSSRATESA